MNYRKDKYGNALSILGFGCMRFPADKEEAEREVLYAIDQGVNYFDTAYIYPGNESALGEILHKNNVREKVRIATKLPHYLIKSVDGLEKMFREQLKRLKTDYVDYYLMHMLSDIAAWERLRELGIEDWLQEKKESGQIRQVGFSYHGNTEMFCTLVDAYDWDMCMIQYNYLDEHSQAGRRGLEYAHAKGLPVMIMEPLRGGRLVNKLPAEAHKIFAGYPVQNTPAQWAFRWLWNQKEVTCVLSGMNSGAMVRENIETACTAHVGDLGENEEKMLEDVVAAINAKMKVGCTGCSYCMPCPCHVDIPGTFAAYNARYSESKFWAVVEYIKCTALRRTNTAASNCIGCGKCEKHCPQRIAIRAELKNAQKELEGPLYRTVRRVVEKFKLF